MARIEETTRPRSRCAVYTRKSTEEGLEQDYNSIDAQRDAGHVYAPRGLDSRGQRL